MPQPSFQFVGKAISIKQPWASAIAFAGKDIENRTWRTRYRGPIAIHASGKLMREDLDRRLRTERGGEKRPVIDWIKKGRRPFRYDEDADPVVLSHIVAIGMLVDCVDRSRSVWFGGDWGFVLRGVIPIEPVPMVGGLGLWNSKFRYRPLQIA